MPDSDRSAESDKDARLGLRVSENLLDARTVLIFGEVNTALAERVSAQLLCLNAESSRPIRVVLHSQGGHVEAGFTIFDVIRSVEAEVKMIGTGWVVSAGALIFVAAPPERRVCLPNTRFMLHQPLGGVGGPASDVEIEAAQIIGLRHRLNELFARETGQDYEKIQRETERNLWLSASEARAYGLVSRVIERLSEA
ncbi:MAG: ATP-dependent Clp protease proteolytic subunit [Deltaproteobacteria bacterium]